MEIQCTGCNKRFIIPEEKIPQKDTFQVRCPQCHNRITVSLKERMEEGSKETKEQPQELPPEEVPVAAAAAEEMYSDVPLALVCEDNPSYQALIKGGVESLGYKAVLVQNPEEALERIKLVQYEVVVLSEDFGGGGSSSNSTLLIHLQTMPMSSRRNIFFTLYGKNLKTMDNFMAFVKSANLVININDLSNLENILKRAIEDDKQFYRVFKDYLRELGKL
jgi:predicted Zn finger-like uncharacterized protein